MNWLEMELTRRELLKQGIKYSGVFFIGLNLGLIGLGCGNKTQDTQLQRQALDRKELFEKLEREAPKISVGSSLSLLGRCAPLGREELENPTSSILDVSCQNNGLELPPSIWNFSF